MCGNGARTEEQTGRCLGRLAALWGLLEDLWRRHSEIGQRLQQSEVSNENSRFFVKRTILDQQMEANTASARKRDIDPATHRNVIGTLQGSERFSAQSTTTG